MVSCCPLRIGLWDPLQMAFSWLINGGDPNHLHPLGSGAKISGKMDEHGGTLGMVALIINPYNTHLHLI